MKNKLFIIGIARYLLMLPVICGCFLFLTYCWRLYVADVYYKKSRSFIEKGMFEQAFDYIQKAVETNLYEPSYYRERARVYVSLQIDQNSETTKVLKDFAYKDLQHSINLNQDNLASVRNALPYFYYLAVNDIKKPVDLTNFDNQYLKIAQKFFEDTKVKYSTDAGTLVDIATYEKKLLLQRDYEETKETIKGLRPDLLEWHEVLK